jgi:predicted RNase H-like HicB family nuclease
MKGLTMTQRKRYTALFHREDGWWIVRIAEAKGVHSNGRTLEEAKRRVREALSLDIGDGAFSVDIVDKVTLPSKARTKLAGYRTARRRAQAEQGKATAATRAAARALKEAGLSVRDAGNLLGLTGSRVSQLLNEPD